MPFQNGLAEMHASTADGDSQPRERSALWQYTIEETDGTCALAEARSSSHPQDDKKNRKLIQKAFKKMQSSGF